MIRSKIDPRNILVRHGSNRVIAALLPWLTGSTWIYLPLSQTRVARTGPKRRRPERYQYPAHGGAKPDPGRVDKVDIANKERKRLGLASAVLP